MALLRLTSVDDAVVLEEQVEELFEDRHNFKGDHYVFF